MALDALLGTGAGMLILRDRPFLGGVTLRAILTKQFYVYVFGGMAGRTIQHRFLRRETRMSGCSLRGRLMVVDPVHQLLTNFQTQFVGHFSI